MPTALVTGATGLVGGALVERLAAEGWRVRALVRPHTNATALEVFGVEAARGDITQPASLRPACAGADVVFHAAARVGDWAPARSFRAANVEGARAVAEAAATAHVPRFVHVSTTNVYGFPDRNDVDEDAPLRPRGWGYLDSKIEGERAVRAVAESTRMPLVIVRPGAVFGPGARDTVSRLADRMRAGRLRLIDHGRHLAGFVYAPNLARGLILAATHPRAAGRVYNLHDATQATWEEYADLLAAAVGAPKPDGSISRRRAAALASIGEALGKVLRRPPAVTRQAVAVAGTDQEFRTDRAREELGYLPEVPFAEAVRRSADWYLDRKGRASGLV